MSAHKVKEFIFKTEREARKFNANKELWGKSFKNM